MKKQRLKLPKYLDAVGKYVTCCVKCGTTEGLQVAHYSGLYSNRLGNGMGSKSHDYCVARLCQPCHAAFDGYAGDNDDGRAENFIDCIYLTMRELAIVKDTTIPPPAGLKNMPWLETVAKDFMWLITADSELIDADYLVEFLALKRDEIEAESK